MAEQEECSVECSEEHGDEHEEEHGEVPGVLGRGEEGNNLSQNSSGSSEYLEALVSSDELLGESSGRPRESITSSRVGSCELVPSTSLDKPENVVAARVVPSGERDETDHLVSSFLLKQLRSLAVKERGLEDRLTHERIEHVVEKVEGEVEFEQVINEMWFTMRADDEAQEMERRERDFEMERREVQLEEQVELLQSKVRRLEDENFALQKKQEEMETSSVLRDPKPQKAIFLAFEDMLKEADERAKQDRHIIESKENELQQEQRRVLENERHLESRLLAMETEVSRLSAILREAELAISVEQNRRKEARVEVDQVLEIWKEERRIRAEYEDKSKRLISFLVSIKENLTTEEDVPSVLKDLDKELQRMSSKRFSTKRAKLMESEQSARWKSQRDAAVAERDSLEEKLNLHLRRARDREAEIEAMWVERERNLVTKCSSLEAAVAHWESRYKKRDAEVRKLSEMELEAHRKWVEEQVTKWTSLLEAKDRELSSLRKELQELKNHPPQQMLENSSQTNISCESYQGRNSEDSDGEGCQSIENFEKEKKLSSSLKLMDELRTEFDAEKKFVSEPDVEKLRLEKEELEKQLSRTLHLLDELRTEFDAEKKFVSEPDVEKLRLEKEELEKQLSRTLHLMDELRTEKQSLEDEILSKSAELGDLACQLSSRDRQMETLMQKFRDEVLSIDREVEKERKEKEEVMEMHFVGKRRLVAEIREKEERWQNDLEAITQELLESRELARQKDEDIIIVKGELHALDEQRKADEEIFTKRVYSLIKEKDGLALAYDREQKAREVAEAECQRLEGEHIVLLEKLNQEHKEMLYMRQELLEEMAVLQGALKELEWSIMHGDVDVKAKLAKVSSKEGLVQVHTSHLEEVDQYVLELQKKLEESEKKRKSAEVAASVRELKRVSSFDVALVHGDRVTHDGHLTSHLALENGAESLRVRTRSSPGHRSGRSSFSSIREIQPDTHWEVENSSSVGRHGGNISSSTWQGQPRDEFTLSVPPLSPGRRQQKWLVDAAWLENVRKEQTFLRQQLELERQRVCSLGQVEAENRLIEAAIVRAVEEKHESESKVLDLQQEVILLKKMLASRSSET